MPAARTALAPMFAAKPPVTTTPAKARIRAAAVRRRKFARPAKETQHDSPACLLLRRRMEARAIAAQLLHETRDATHQDHRCPPEVFLSSVRTFPIASVQS